MATKTKNTTKNERFSTDEGLFTLKLALYVILGSLWIKISNDSSMQLPLPIGLVIGLILASHEHFRIDRKIEFAVLMVASLVGFLAPYGLYVAF